MLKYLLVGIMLASGCNNNPVMASTAQSSPTPSIDLDAIAWIESSFNPNAINKKTMAIGMYQITPVVLKDYNNMEEKENERCQAISNWYKICIDDRYTLHEMLDSNKCQYVADWYFTERIPQLLKSIHKTDTVENRLWAYNAGIRSVKRGIMPIETRNYIKKYWRYEND